MYTENLSTFFDLPVVDFNSPDDWKGVRHAYRLREEYEDETTIADRLQALGGMPQARELTALVIGAWSEAFGESNSAPIIAGLAGVAAQLAGLRGLFLGDMTYEECEVSWIKQADIAPLLKAYPRLEELRVRGGEGLSISRVTHRSLRTLGIETGGLPRSVLRELFACELPALEQLELLLGEENYGFDGSVEDLQPLLTGDLFPRLEHLGLMNSVIANDIAAVVVNSPLVHRLKTLDLSMGTLDDEGAKSLQELAGCGNLKLLILSHHYITEAALQELRAALKCEIIADNPEDLTDDFRAILHAE
ncbi:MAG: STM4015 family protein [Planctomycetales bacterium]